MNEYWDMPVGDSAETVEIREGEDLYLLSRGLLEHDPIGLLRPVKDVTAAQIEAALDELRRFNGSA